MRLGISSALAHTSPEDWAQKQEALGCRAVVFPLNCEEDPDRIEAYAEAAREHDLMIAEVGIWRNPLSPKAEEAEQNLRYCVDQLKLADRLGARCCVNIAGAFGEIWDGYYRENFGPVAMQKTVDCIREILEKADPKQTCFTIEPMPWMIPTGPEQYLELIDRVGHPQFGVHMDLINMINSAERYFEPEAFADHVFDLLAPQIRSCHIKDVHLAQEFTFRLEECAPGQGEFPLRYYMEKAHAADPEMPVILEHLNRDEDYIKYFEVIREEANGI